jgi:hypothetical protein
MLAKLSGVASVARCCDQPTAVVTSSAVATTSDTGKARRMDGFMSDVSRAAIV